MTDLIRSLFYLACSCIALCCLVSLVWLHGWSAGHNRAKSICETELAMIPYQPRRLK